MSILTQKQASFILLWDLVSFSIDSNEPILFVVLIMTLAFQNSIGKFGRLIQFGIKLVILVSSLNPLCHCLSTSPFLPKNHGPYSKTFSISSLHLKLKSMNSLGNATRSTFSFVFHFPNIHLLIISKLDLYPTNLFIKVFFCHL